MITVYIYFISFNLCLQATTLYGYNIPKDTSIMANLHSVHFDPKLFLEPDKFEPSRFIVDGELENTEYVLTMGLGKWARLIKTSLLMFLFSLLLYADRAPCSLRWVVHGSMLFYSPHSSLSL